MQDIDLLCIVTRPDFPSGNGPIGDHLGLSRFAAQRPSLVIRTLVLNDRDTRVHFEGGDVLITQGEGPPLPLHRARLVVYMPICLEVEEMNLAAIGHDEAHPLFAARQWRPLTEYLEHVLPRLTRCVNTPGATRRANNKLIQLDSLRRAGLLPPLTAVSTGFPDRGMLAARTSLVRKNVSEGGWKSPTEFSPARLVAKGEPCDLLPAIWQIPLHADHEYRAYVMGEDVTFVRLERDASITDVRMTRSGRPEASLVAARDEWKVHMLAAARALDLDYAVIDAMPADEGLAILEVNANGVWWFLPEDVARVLETRFHRFVDGLLAQAPRRALGETGSR